MGLTIEPRVGLVLHAGLVLQFASMSPTVFRDGRYRGFFFSREEPRMHVHVSSPDGEAKFWIDPLIALATHTGLTTRELRRMQRLVEAHHDEIVRSWKAHFGGSEL